MQERSFSLKELFFLTGAPDINVSSALLNLKSLHEHGRVIKNTENIQFKKYNDFLDVKSLERVLLRSETVEITTLLSFLIWKTTM